MTLTIRYATPHDAETIVRLIQGLAEYERDPAAVEVTPAQLRSQMDGPNPPFECLVAEYEADPVAFALFFRNYSTWRGRSGLYLEDIFVREEYRGRGIGGALMRRLAKIAVERNWGRMEWAVLDWNTPRPRLLSRTGRAPARGLDSLAPRR